MENVIYNDLVSQTTSSFLSAGGIFLGYLVPGKTLAGFHSMEDLFIEIGSTSIDEVTLKDDFVHSLFSRLRDATMKKVERRNVR